MHQRTTLLNPSGDETHPSSARGSSGHPMPPSITNTQKETLDRIIDEAVSSRSTPASYFGVASAEGVLYQRTAGRKQVDDPESAPINEDTLFWVCSQTKLITTIAALLLIERGQIALDTVVETILPELANPVVVTSYDEAGWVKTSKPAKEKITLGNLLNHTSGLDYWADRKMPSSDLPLAYTYRYKDGEGVATFFQMLKSSSTGVLLAFEPGTGFGYGFSTDCVGFIIERLSGKTLEQYFQDHIFTPLGITSASFYLTPELRDRLLPLSFRNKNGDLESWDRPPVIEQDPDKVRFHLGGVGLYSSQHDYLKVLQHLLQIKAGNAANAILTRTSVDLLFTPTLPGTATKGLRSFMRFTHPLLNIPNNAAQFSWGLFVNSADIKGKRRSGSGAWDGFATTSFFIDPTTGLAAVFATQLLPVADATHEEMYDVLERALYSDPKARL